jgi:glycosyltransferase involved in cell wall biosynthesis
MQDLAMEFSRQGWEPTVIVPSSELKEAFSWETIESIRVFRVRAPRSKDIGYMRRAVAELFMPLSVVRGLRVSPLNGIKWDGVVSYSPSIFLGPVVNHIKSKSGCRSYLILRDIFPDWAADMGLMGRGLPYRIFKAVERYQYSVSDVIGVQTDANLAYFDDWAERSFRRVEVLHNWLAKAPNVGCSISVEDTMLAGRRILVYAGNMGVAQGMDLVLGLVESLQDRKDIGFLFVGRGSESQRLRDYAVRESLNNVLFYDEIDPAEIPGLYAQCHVGIVSLDPRHKTHNIPGKFLSYMQGGIPVLASVNPGNDLAELIGRENVGRASTDGSVQGLRSLTERLLDEDAADPDLRLRCANLASRLFSPERAVSQIIRAFA